MPSDPPPDWVLDIRRRIGDKVRAARERRGVTQERLGEMTGIDRKTINRIERGTHAFSIDRLTLIAGALDTPLADLMP